MTLLVNVDAPLTVRGPDVVTGQYILTEFDMTTGPYAISVLLVFTTPFNNSASSNELDPVTCRLLTVRLLI